MTIFNNSFVAETSRLSLALGRLSEKYARLVDSAGIADDPEQWEAVKRTLSLSADADAIGLKLVGAQLRAIAVYVDYEGVALCRAQASLSIAAIAKMLADNA